MANDGLVHSEIHDPEAGVIPLPHGPEDGGEEAAYPSTHTTENERQIFAYLLHPDDSYTPEGVYWADLPLRKRVQFVLHVDAEESALEFNQFWSAFKKDPLSPFGWYFRHAILPGAGLGLEGYVLFSIGLLEGLFDTVWGSCWSSYQVCSSNLIATVTYLEVLGIMVGQVVVGIIGDWLGRRWGLIQDVVIMFIALLMLTGSWGVDLSGWVICYAISLFIYGVGVGGEYPMTATSSMEGGAHTGKVSTKEDRLHRGRKVTMAFLMQGWGQFFNQVILILALLIFNHGPSPPYSESAAQATFRVSFAIPAVGTLWLVYYRTYKMKSASKQLELSKKKSSVTGYDTKSLGLTFSIFGSRIFATAGTWFCNDVFFYGNKLFQGQFIKVISPGASIFVNWEWSLVNIVVALCGYYLASFTIDNKLYGRKLMMQVGFFGCFILFVIPAFNFGYYTSPAGIHTFQAMYFLSSFFNQWGPNSVTFLTAAECYPTAVRATAHGFSAAVGKSGALLASVLYNYIDNQTKFYVVPWFGLAGMLITLMFIPDTTGLDLKEADRRWTYIRAGRESEYHGIAVHPQHLSLYERLRGVGKYYDPDVDYKTKIEDMRHDWLMKMEDRKKAEMEGTHFDDDDDLTEDVHHYFHRTTTEKAKVKNGALLGEKEAL